MKSLRSVAPLFALGLIGLTIVAFWPSYLGRPFANVDRYTHAHAALGTIWLLLLLAQTTLIKAGRRGLHLALGRLSYAAAPLFALSGVLLANFRFSRMDEATFAKEAYTLYLPLSVSLLFLCAYGLALVHRRSIRLHGCFMLCTALVLVDPVVARTLAFHVVQFPAFWHYQIVTFSIEFLALAGLLLSLPSDSAERKTFGGFSFLFVLVQLLWFVAPRTTAWERFATWFRHLPLT